MKISIGMEVERVSSDYTNGRRGEVVEIDGGRARVKWSGSPRTWVKFSCLRVIAPAAKIVGGWVATPGMKTIAARRRVEVPALGLVFCEYVKR